MVIEAVFEDINIKHAVLKEVEAVSVTEMRLNRALLQKVVHISQGYYHLQWSCDY